MPVRGWNAGLAPPDAVDRGCFSSPTEPCLQFLVKRVVKRVKASRFTKPAWAKEMGAPPAPPCQDGFLNFEALTPSTSRVAMIVKIDNPTASSEIRELKHLVIWFMAPLDENPMGSVQRDQAGRFLEEGRKPRSPG